MDISAAVVPGYYLVCYNRKDRHVDPVIAVVPGYYLVCYNDHKNKPKSILL